MKIKIYFAVDFYTSNISKKKDVFTYTTSEEETIFLIHDNSVHHSINSNEKHVLTILNSGVYSLKNNGHEFPIIQAIPIYE